MAALTVLMSHVTKNVLILTWKKTPFCFTFTFSHHTVVAHLTLNHCPTKQVNRQQGSTVPTLVHSGRKHYTAKFVFVYSLQWVIFSRFLCSRTQTQRLCLRLQGESQQVLWTVRSHHSRLYFQLWLRSTCIRAGVFTLCMNFTVSRQLYLTSAVGLFIEINSDYQHKLSGKGYTLFI